MKREYVLKGLHCANCAAKIENAVKKHSGVSVANYNFVTSTLTLTTKEANLNITPDIEHIVHGYEPDVMVVDMAVENIRLTKVTETDNNNKRQINTLMLGALIFAAALAASALKSSVYLSSFLFISAYLVLGGGVVLNAVKNLTKGRVFDENLLMSIATIGAFAIGDFAEAVAVMLFYRAGEFFQDLAVNRSRKSIAGLMDLRPDYANVKSGINIITMPPDEVKPGDIIIVKPGEKIPLDGVISGGEGFLDTSSLTGESLPRAIKPGDTALSGCVSQNALLEIKVTKPYGESTVSKIIELVENASAKKAPTERFITKFSRYYTPIVVILAAALAIIPPLVLGGGWAEWLNRGLIFLVVSCPCALVISIPLGFFGGIGRASRQGVLVKGGNVLEALNKLDIVAFDKTGTLTKGVFEVTHIHAENGYTADMILELAAHAEAFSTHPIALSIRAAYKKHVDTSLLSSVTETAGRGMIVSYNGKKLLAGGAKLLESSGIVFNEPGGEGSKVCIAYDGKYAGCIVISDNLKPDSIEAVKKLKARGVRKTVMLTGDSPAIAKNIAQELSLDEFHAGLLPHEKVETLERLMTNKHPKKTLAFAGDGINDAPVLARADIGIAMGGLGSDAAIEVADVVIMSDELSRLALAVDTARATHRVVLQNIIMALGIKALVLLLSAFGFAAMWAAIFADVGVSLLAIVNSMKLIKADRTLGAPPPNPRKL